MAVSAAEFTDRAKAAEVWRPFCIRKQELLATKSKSEADRVARREFWPLIEAYERGEQIELPGQSEERTPQAAEVSEGAYDGPEVALVEEVLWAKSNASGNVTAADAPSPGAWRLRELARTDFAEFSRLFLSKLMPSKAQLDASERFTDDGREQFAILERFEEYYRDTVLPSRAQGSAGELPLAPQGAGAGG